MPGTYVNEKNDLIFIGNDRVELGFSKSSNGALVSLVDKDSGYEFRRDADAPASLFRLALRRNGETEPVWLSSRSAATFEWAKQEEDDGATIRLTVGGFPDAEASVVVEARLPADSALSFWRMRVVSPGDATVFALTCPILSGFVKIGDAPAGEAIAWPRHGEGYLFRDPFPVRDRLPLCAGAGPESPNVGTGALGGRYPGFLPMQLCLYYNDRAGLYLATHDADQHVKDFNVAPLEDEDTSPVFSITHYPGEGPGENVAFTYDTVVGVFHGDWYDGADIYKAWATRQWWCGKKLRERDIPDWMRRGFAVFQMSNYHIPFLKMNHPMPQIAETVNAVSREAGVPLAALIFNWEGQGAWTGPSGLFPPREGEPAFTQAMDRLREAGNMGFVYVPGGCWYFHADYDQPFDGAEGFEREARPYAVMQPDGSIRQTRPAGMLRAARLCPHTAFAKDLHVSMYLKCLDLGCTIVQIDNFPCGSSEACHDAAHGHPIGYGPWWSEAWCDILAEVRRQGKERHPDCAITVEGVAENFIPFVDLFDHRAANMEYFGHFRAGDPMGGETIPLFNYVYHEYVGSYVAAFPECNRPEVLYWTRCLGKAMVQGVVPTGGHYFPEPKELNPVTIRFYTKVARAAARECWPYLMFGEMLRPPDIDVPKITAQYLKMTDDIDRLDPNRRHEVVDNAVQCAAFRGDDGRIGYFFINVSEKSVSFDVAISDYGMGAASYDVDRVIDGVRETWLSETDLPRTEQIHLTPLSIMLVEVGPKGGDGK